MSSRNGLNCFVSSFSLRILFTCFLFCYTFRLSIDVCIFARLIESNMIHTQFELASPNCFSDSKNIYFGLSNQSMWKIWPLAIKAIQKKILSLFVSQPECYCINIELIGFKWKSFCSSCYVRSLMVFSPIHFIWLKAKWNHNGLHQL